MTSTQWQNFLRNLGAWKGSFTRYAADGQLINDTPTLVTFEGFDDNTRVKQQVFKYPPNEPEPDPITLEYRNLGRNILFFEDGAFSFGSVQFSPVSDFGAEQGLIREDRRLRVVQLFDKGEFSGVTLIREFREGTDANERPPLTAEQLVGNWQGELTTVYPDLREPETSTSHLSIELDGDKLTQRIQTPYMEIRSTGRVKGDRIHFDTGKTPMQVLLLPDGASCNVPLTIPRQSLFFLEIGWLVEPDLRYRLMRTYDASGQWRSSTQVIERRV